MTHDQTIFDEGSADIVDAGQSSAERPVLIVLDGGDLKNRYHIDHAEMLIGRDVTADVNFSDSKASRRHAKLTYVNVGQPQEKPKVLIEDLGSTNGTIVNGTNISEPVELEDRDKILIGSILFGFFIRDETTMKADERLIKLASVDALTGLSNRGVFNLEIHREFDRARRYARDLTLVMLDIDHFKKFNDTYGHQAGDLVLKELGQIALTNSRSNDTATRYGGEEFAIILPETSLENAVIQAERLRVAVAEHKFQAGENILKVTVSVGLAMLDPSVTRAEELIEAADRALYKAKDSGRNQVCWQNVAPVDRLGGTVYLTGS